MNFPDSPYYRLSLSLVFLALIGVFAVQKYTPSKVPHIEAAAVEVEPDYSILKPNTMSKKNKDRDVFNVVKQMPIYPGADCGYIKDYEERKACSEKAMLKYVYKHIKYPKKAKEKGVHGVAVVRFVVEPNGVMSDIKIVRDPGAGLGKAAAKVVKKMQKDNTRWEPGLHKGKPVAVQFLLPVKFQLK